jgi:radical SAM protein with 4Fe4S-binding SPASM domain
MTYEKAPQERFPDISRTTLAEALTSSSYDDLVHATFGDVLAHDPLCAACAFRSRCLGGCRAQGTDGHGNPDLLGRDPEACRFFLGGYYDRARALVEQLTTH